MHIYHPRSEFSTWFRAPIKIDHFSYTSVMHYMVTEKALLFKDDENYQTLVAMKDTTSLHTLSRQIRNFDEKVWDQHKTKFCLEGNLAKFTQHPLLRAQLLQTGAAILGENYPDPEWCIGYASQNPELWTGKNLAGKSLMNVRSILQASLIDY